MATYDRSELPTAVVTASELARDGARVRRLAASGWVLVTRRGRPVGAILPVDAAPEAIERSRPVEHVSARDLSRTGAVSEMLDAAAAGRVTVLTDHNRPAAVLVSADAFVSRLDHAVTAMTGDGSGSGSGLMGPDALLFGKDMEKLEHTESAEKPEKASPNPSYQWPFRPQYRPHYE